jgi:16S rRNA (uracil1498-N3)-methyltransferase
VWADGPDEVPWHHVRDVLRLRPGDTYAFVCGDGFEYRARLVAKDRVEVLGRVALAPPAVRVSLYVGLLKSDAMDGVVQRATEIGVERIVAMQTERSLGGARLDRWRRIVRASAAQCRRGTCPEVAGPVRFEEAIGAGPGVLFWERASASLTGLVGSEVAVFVGPEGGFSEAEARLAEGRGVKICSLGARILRAETAAVVAPVLVMAALGEPGFS